MTMVNQFFQAMSADVAFQLREDLDLRQKDISSARTST